jgi:hypothetical protein
MLDIERYSVVANVLRLEPDNRTYCSDRRSNRSLRGQSLAHGLDGLIHVSMKHFGLSRRGGIATMESDVRYYLRRMQSERAAAHRALTSAARERRLALVQIYEAKLAALGG